MDRIDIHVEVPRVDYEKLADKRHAETPETIRKHVQAAPSLHGTIYPKRTIQINSGAPLHASFSLDPALFLPQLMHENHTFAFFLYYELPDLCVFEKKEDLYFYSEASPQGYVVFHQSPVSQVELRGDRLCACALWNRLVSA